MSEPARKSSGFKTPINATVMMAHNPFNYSSDRDVFSVTKPVSIKEWLRQQNIDEFEKPTICLYNGKPVLRKHWELTYVNDNALVSFVALPQGGGGGGGSDPLRTVLTLAIVVAAAWAGPALAGLSVFSGLSTTGLGIVSAIGSGLVTAAGNFLLNALLPPPKPTAPNTSLGNSTPNPSPTYSLQAQGNSARLHQPIPSLYGRHLIYPDFGAVPWSQYQDNDQYLHQLHVIGQGHYDFEKIRIEDTPISSFDEIETEIINPGDALTLFDINIVASPEIAGQEAIAPNKLAQGEDGWIGPFVANSATSIANRLSFDIVFPRGLYYATDQGGLSTQTVTWDVRARLVDDDGLSTGNWIALGSETYSAATQTQQRVSYDYDVAPGRYEVSIKRTNDKNDDARYGHEMRWGGLRARVEQTPDFSGKTLLALRMKATDNLSSRSAKLINCIVQRKLPIWHPETGWSQPVATRSIAWAFADICRADYGAKLADKRIDLASLYKLDQVWTARNNTFDAVFDQTQTVWDALDVVARCGRAVRYQQGGVVRIIRDEAVELPVAMFGPRNITKNSFKIEFIMPSDDTADSVKVEFFNSKTWKPDFVTVKLPGSLGEKPASVRMIGIVDETHAEEEGLYMAAANYYRRKIVSFRTEMDGFIPTYGDLISISHDMPEWGQGGEVIAWQPVTKVMSFSEPLEWREGEENHYVALRKLDGSFSGPWKVTPGDEPHKVILQDELDFEPYTGGSKERTYFSFGPGTEYHVLAKVKSLAPKGDKDVDVMCVVEHASVHTADQLAAA